MVGSISCILYPFIVSRNVILFLFFDLSKYAADWLVCDYVYSETNQFLCGRLYTVSAQGKVRHNTVKSRSTEVNVTTMLQLIVFVFQIKPVSEYCKQNVLHLVCYGMIS
jgi:hypothetical protein